MKLLLSAITLSITLFMQPAVAAIDNNCEPILSGAETAFKDLFPPGPATQVLGSWCFRVYPLGDITRITGVNNLKTDEFNVGVYVVGPPFGDDPIFIGSSAQVLTIINDLSGGGGNSQEQICDTSKNIESGIKTIQNGNLITVTTEGKCVQLPKNNSFCDPAVATDDVGNPIATGVSMLTVTELVSFDIKGLPTLPTLPGFPNPLDSIVDSFVSNTCFIHVQEDIAEFDTKTDVCFDISDLVGNLPGISDKVTLAFEANSQSTIVDNCANTGADTIIDLVNGGL